MRREGSDDDAHQTQRGEITMKAVQYASYGGPDVLKALKKDPVTTAIPVVVFTGLSRKNALRLEKDGAFGFLDKSVLELDKGCDALLAAVAEIVRKLNLEVPPAVAAK